MTVTFMRIYSWGEFEFLRAPRRVGLPAAAGGTAPVELARLEAAGLAAVAREAAGMAVHQIAHQLQIPALVRGAGGDDLRFQQPIEAEQGGIAPQLVAHQPIRLLVPFRLEGVLEHGIEQIERWIALEVAREEMQALFRAPRLAMGFEQALRGEGEVGRILRLDALPLLDRFFQILG